MTVPEKHDPPEGFTPIISENPFGKAVGPIYEKKTDNDWVRGFYVEEKHSNRANIAHGGVIMTFADIVLATAVFEAINMRDRPVVLGGVLFFATVFVLMNLLVDLIYVYLDPRIQLGQSKS